MLRDWQEAWLLKNFRSYTTGGIYNGKFVTELYVDRDEATPELLSVIRSWPNLEMFGYSEDIDIAIRYVRCACGRELGYHDCVCDCGEVMKPVVVKHPEFGYADEIFTCARCGNRGASRSFIQFPK